MHVASGDRVFRAESGKLLTLLAICLFPLALVGGTPPDTHWSGDEASTLYQRSPFAHGFIHGYEDGFAAADTVYQLGLPPSDPEATHQFKDADRGYQSTFGSKDRFKRGYREGFRSGYDDSLHNRHFRGVSAARDAAIGLPDDPGRAFDPGFSSGFKAAEEAGALDTEPLVCDAQLANKQREIKAGYCDGFQRGARFWRDAAALPSEGSIQTAAKR